MSQSTKYKTYINSLDKDELTKFVNTMGNTEDNVCGEYIKSVNRMGDYDYIDSLINKRSTDVIIHTINMLKLGIIKLNELENLEKVYFNTNRMNIIIEGIKQKIILRQILSDYVQEIDYDFNSGKFYSDLKKKLIEDYNINPVPAQKDIKQILNSTDFHQFIINIDEQIIEPFLDYVKKNKIIFDNDESENKVKFKEYQQYASKLYIASNIPLYKDLQEVIIKIYNYRNKLKLYY
jgi:hypothetical protein